MLCWFVVVVLGVDVSSETKPWSVDFSHPGHSLNDDTGTKCVSLNLYLASIKRNRNTHVDTHRDRRVRYNRHTEKHKPPTKQVQRQTNGINLKPINLKLVVHLSAFVKHFCTALRHVSAQKWE